MQSQMLNLVTTQVEMGYKTLSNETQTWQRKGPRVCCVHVMKANKVPLQVTTF
jgi:hypothetical protein